MKWKEECGSLADVGAFVIGDYGDLFSLHAVYVPLIEVDVEAHYIAMRGRKKKVTTANPDYPSGTRRRDELYSTFESGLTHLTLAEVEETRQIGLSNSPPDLPSPWQIDPLDFEEDRAARTDAIESAALLMASEQYVMHRSFTKFLVSAPGARAEAKMAALEDLAEFRRRFETARQ